MIEQERARGIVRKMGSGLALAALLACVGSASAQYPKDGVELLAHLPPSQFGASAGNDCWGYVSPSGREYALMSYNNTLAVVEITDPRNPVAVGTIPHSNSTWGDVKVYRDHCYHSNESGGGVQVISLADVDNGQVSLVRSVGPPTSHNVAIDEDSGFLYTAGSRGGQSTTVIFDLSTPSNPVQVGSYPGPYQHDIQTVTYTSGPYAGKQILFGSSEGRGLQIFDVTNKNAITMLSQTPYPDVTYCHQGWLSPDQKYFYIDDELDEQSHGLLHRTIVMDVTNLSVPVYVTTFSTGLTNIDHNLYVTDDWLIFEADYTAGLQIFDANADPEAPVKIGFFDTYPENNSTNFNGAWSTYPYFPSGTAIISDINRGLFVVDVSGSISGLTFDYPNGRPQAISPAGGDALAITIEGRNTNVRPGSGLLHYDVGNGFQTTPLNELGGDDYEAVFPASPCGETVKYYISAETAEGDLKNDPSDAPAGFYSAISAEGFDVVFADNFEQNRGWTVTNNQVADGAWERAVPVPNGSGGAPLADYDGSGQCYVTANRAGNSDVDGGPTVLTSPLIDLSGGDAVVEYARSMANDDGDDLLVTEVSNNDGGNWVQVDSVNNSGGWQLQRFTVSDYVAPTAIVRVRFSVADNPNNSVTEAGIDAFAVSRVQCEQEPITCQNIRKLTGKCKRGNVKGKVVLTDASHNGQSVTVGINQTPFEVAVVGKVAKYKQGGFQGQVTISLDDPADCVDPLVRQCR